MAKLNLPDYKSKLVITPQFEILFEHAKPNFFHRFFYWFLLGWKWENYNKGNE